MSIRTQEELVDSLADDLAWRKRELSEIKKLVADKSVSIQRHNVLVRSGVCILYSHWEGFVKLAANSYLEYVRLQKLTYDQLSINFLALALKEKLNSVSATNKPSLYIPVCSFFLEESEQRSFLPRDAISTASNLSSTILKEVTSVLGIEFSYYSTKSVLIDTKLLRARNAIAHGNYLDFDRDEYIELHGEVISMLDVFRNQIENAAIEQKYLRISS